MKTAISIPDPVFEAAEKLARQLKISRSELYATALATYLEREQADDVTRRLNEVYAKAESSIEPEWLQAQAQVIVKEEW
jgi:predicted transcriptional regulator